MSRSTKVSGSQAGRQTGKAGGANPSEEMLAYPSPSGMRPTLFLPCWWANVRYADAHGAGFGVARLYARAERCETDWDRGVDSAADPAGGMVMMLRC